MSISPADALTWAREKFADNTAQVATATDENAVIAAIRSAKQAIADGASKIAAAAGFQSRDRSSADPRKQALFDAVYVVAAADGSVSPTERAKLTIGMYGMLGEGFEESSIEAGLDMAHELFQQAGVKGTAASVAEQITDERDRSAVLMIASTVAWLGGGVGTKEGLALQALTSAFGLQIKQLHEIMGAAARIAKA